LPGKVLAILRVAKRGFQFGEPSKVERDRRACAITPLLTAASAEARDRRLPYSREDMNMACKTSRELRSLGLDSTRRAGFGSCFAVCAALTLALGVLAASPRTAAAQATEEPGGLKDASPHERPMMLSFFTGINYGYYASYGFPLTLGGRFYIPLVRDGFIRTLNDEFGIEFGLDLNFDFISDRYHTVYGYDSTIFGIAFPVEAMYDFHFTRTFDAYVKAGFIFGGDFSDHLHDGFYFNFVSAVGLRWAMTDMLYLRAEAGYPWIKAGIGFAF
jgi:hypothetical protein